MHARKDVGAECDLRHSVRFPTILERDFVGALWYAYRITKGKTHEQLLFMRSRNLSVYY
jgi:hypothetical protein